MITITITGERTPGRALLYELPRRGGRRAFVPTYVAQAHCSVANLSFGFAVVRDVSPHIFGERPADPYGVNGECPPSADTPYRGVVRTDGYVGFRIELFELQYADTRELMGQGAIRRKKIQIHFGAAASFGCILVAGRRRDYGRAFVRPLQAMLAHTDQIVVIVEPRPRT